MPTGYTADVLKGIGFREFVMTCARGMGANILMRDSPMDAPIKEYEPSMYYFECAEKGKAELAMLEHMTLEEAGKRSMEDYNQQIRTWEEDDEENALFDKMLDKVRNWIPPTTAHIPFKEFMIEQLEISKNKMYPHTITLLPPKEWLDLKINRLKESIKFDLKRHEEELQRTKEQNQWNADLKISLEGIDE